MVKKKVLLHICCGVCAGYCIELLQKYNYEVVGFYFNPNIAPEEEYIKRKKVVEKIKEIYKIQIFFSEYNPSLWWQLCGGYKEEPEGGKRCKICYMLRLKETYNYLSKLNCDFFTTTLTISPHKNSETIFEIAKEINKDSFLQIDFKKEDGFKKTMEIAKKNQFYIQNYCGCLYSINNKKKNK
ncbi:MAG: epoxyqueuosine reductase QueH [Elusimicrobiota bacterium]|nr:epoxyqueuosine reductase QueH [Endomicrobiia bacterium]MCX7910485.1 epoxyqueuosine reductase QueH [Endomicrobiia bacterium]MDW8166331.1 epoxyqueuosine reductase QueH [Elusimicrobiota bacterium]